MRYSGGSWRGSRRSAMGLGQMASYHPWVVPPIGSHTHHHNNDSPPISLSRTRPTSNRCPHVCELHPASMNDEDASPVSNPDSRADNRCNRIVHQSSRAPLTSHPDWDPPVRAAPPCLWLLALDRLEAGRPRIAHLLQPCHRPPLAECQSHGQMAPPCRRQ